MEYTEDFYNLKGNIYQVTFSINLNTDDTQKVFEIFDKELCEKNGAFDLTVSGPETPQEYTIRHEVPFSGHNK